MSTMMMMMMMMMSQMIMMMLMMSTWPASLLLPCTPRGCAHCPSTWTALCPSHTSRPTFEVKRLGWESEEHSKMFFLVKLARHLPTRTPRSPSLLFTMADMARATWFLNKSVCENVIKVVLLYFHRVCSLWGSQVGSCVKKVAHCGQHRWRKLSVDPRPEEWWSDGFLFHWKSFGTFLVVWSGCPRRSSPPPPASTHPFPSRCTSQILCKYKYKSCICLFIY